VNLPREVIARLGSAPHLIDLCHGSLGGRLSISQSILRAMACASCRRARPHLPDLPARSVVIHCYRGGADNQLFDERHGHVCQVDHLRSNRAKQQVANGRHSACSHHNPGATQNFRRLGDFSGGIASHHDRCVGH